MSRKKRKRPPREKRLLTVLGQAGRPLLLQEIQELLDIAPEQAPWVKDGLDRLIARGDLVLLKGKRYGLTDKMNLTAGTLTVHPDGFGFLTPDGGGKDIFIKTADMKDAWHGDRVVGRLEGRRGKRREARVIRILERAVLEVIGLLCHAADTYYVEPEDEHLLFNLVIPPGKLKGAEPGDVVRAQVTHYPMAHLNPQGEVVEVLGSMEDAEVQTYIVVGKYSLPDQFPPEALAEAGTISPEIIKTELARREDLRHLPLVTIDGESARDFDDGVCVEKKPGGHYTLYVAIADVSHYVKPGSALDQEAFHRGTSVYFPQRAVHMLPPRLSTDICSLNPGEDRLALVVVMDYDRQGRLKNRRFTRAVIHNHARLTYTVVQKLLVDKDRKLRQHYRPFLKMLTWMGELCERLRAQRYSRGSLLMSIPAAEVVLDERGWPVDIKRIDHLLAHQVIEEFMIAANETVSEALGEPSIFRVHDLPDPVKMEAFRAFCKTLGFDLPKQANRDPLVLRDFLEEVRQTNLAPMVQLMLLRSLKQARYAAVNRGHYGLAVEWYTHFTSPIRRYPDLMVHRLLTERLGRPGKSVPPDPVELEDAARYLSERERRAIEAEREMLARMQVRCLAHRVGEEFHGLITGVTPFGFFVSLEEMFADGLVRLVDLPDDYYKYDEARQRLLGRRHRKSFQLGDTVRVTVANVDIKRRHVNLTLVTAKESEKES